MWRVGCCVICRLDCCLFLCVERGEISWKGIFFYNFNYCYFYDNDNNLCGDFGFKRNIFKVLSVVIMILKLIIV